MAAYYNECDPFAAAWLRELITAGLIADGEVDARSIADVSADDVRGFTQCHWFAGIGGWSYALRLAGWDDDRPVWTGSCPCQPFSTAGSKIGGYDPRDLWVTWVELIRECAPLVVFGEQVKGALSHGWFDRACDDLEGAHYAVGAASLPAASVGAYHGRQRLWFVARLLDLPASGRRERERDPATHGLALSTSAFTPVDWIPCRDGRARPIEPGTLPLVDGISDRVGRLRGYGNAIVPQVAAAFIAAYLEL